MGCGVPPGVVGDAHISRSVVNRRVDEVPVPVTPSVTKAVGGAIPALIPTAAPAPTPERK